MKKTLNFFKYFFATSNRFIISTIILLIFAFEAFNNGLNTLLSNICNIFLVFVGALVISVIEFILYVVFYYLWYADTAEIYKIDDANFSENVIPTLYFANVCLFIYLYYKGSIAWK